MGGMFSQDNNGRYARRKGRSFGKIILTDYWYRHPFVDFIGQFIRRKESYNSIGYWLEIDEPVYTLI